jgi:hypothetical protein
MDIMRWLSNIFAFLGLEHFRLITEMFVVRILRWPELSCPCHTAKFIPYFTGAKFRSICTGWTFSTGFPI